MIKIHFDPLGGYKTGHSRLRKFPHMYVKHQDYLFGLGFKECISVANLWWNQGSPLSWDIQYKGATQSNIGPQIIVFIYKFSMQHDS